MQRRTISRRDMLGGCVALGAGAAITSLLARMAGGQQSRPAKRPNIIFILADDLGFECLGAYGAKAYKDMGPVRTPNLDAMARRGMRFRKCFATPVCSPTRAELLTGKYNFRTGFTDIAGRRGAVDHLDAAKHTTLAAALKAAGYATAITGKWHLGRGGDFPGPDTVQTNSQHVKACGFDHQCVFDGAHLRDYGQPKEGLYTPEWFHNWALRFLDGRKGKAEPFFLYYPSPIPHKPLKPTPLNPDAKPGDKDLFLYLIEYLDRQVGELVGKVEQLGMADNTLILFAGDNGTKNTITEMSDGRTIEGGKGLMTDTGSWVPLIAAWPGTTPPGSVCEDLVDFTDMMPTCLELAAARSPDGMDGVSFAPQLRGRRGKPRQWIYVQYRDRRFVRSDRWKLRETGELYDVADSPLSEWLVLDGGPQAADAKKRLQAVLDRLRPNTP